MKTGNTIILYEADISRLTRLEEFICNNLDKELSIAVLASQFGVGQTTLRRHFKLHYGKSVYHSIYEYRMKKAMALLLTRSYPVSQIACQLSYKNLSSFTRAFLKYYQRTPFHYLRISEK